MAVALPSPGPPPACCGSAEADSPYGHCSACGNGSHCMDPKPTVSFLGYSGRLWIPQGNRLQLATAAEPSYLHSFTRGGILPKHLKEKILTWGGREGVKHL